MFIDIAYKTSRMLGYHIPHRKSVIENDGSLLREEIKRRCYWSLFISHCVSQENAAFRSDCWTEAPGLSLPSDEDSFLRNNPTMKEAFGTSGNLIPVDGGPKATQKTSYMGEIVKFHAIWYVTSVLLCGAVLK